MKPLPIQYVILLLVCLATPSIALEFKNEWEIQAGKCENCVQIFDGPQMNYEFAVLNEHLYLTDYPNTQLKMFDRNGRFKKKIKLPAYPESMAVVGNGIHMLLRNNLLATYDADRDTISISTLNFKMSEPQYNYAFLIDSILTIPLNTDWAFLKSDAILINVLDHQRRDTIRGLYDFGGKFGLPSDSTFKHRDPSLLELRGGNEKFYLFDLFESENADTSSGYILFDRQASILRKIPSVPKKYGDTYSSLGKGVKISGDRIYTISEATILGRDKIVVGYFQIKE